MRKILAALLLTLATVAVAQAPGQIIPAMFDDLYADTSDCTQPPLSAFVGADVDYAYCGYISDTMTDINQQIVTRHLGDAGLMVGVPWEYISQEDDLTLYTGGFFGDGWYVISHLVEIGSVDSSFIFVLFTRQ